MRIREIAQAPVRYGYRKIRVLLNREGYDQADSNLKSFYSEMLTADFSAARRSIDEAIRLGVRVGSDLVPLRGKVDTMSDRNIWFAKASRPWLGVAFAFALFLIPLRATGQSPIAEEKEVVAFIFGTVHPINPDKTPKLDANGKPLVLDMPLGTGFFVFYPDKRGGPDYGFSYLVTAKHVLRDLDRTFLRSVNVRINLKLPKGDSAVDFIKDLPVSDEHGKLLWYHGPDEADEAVATNCLPNSQIVEFRSLPLAMFVDDTTLKSSEVEEGDSLYFIGLMAQFYGSKKNFPVVRRGTLAMMTDEDIPSPTGLQKVFIAELQSWPGNSGSPVFLSLGGLRHGGMFLGENLRFLGILLGDFVNKIPASVVGGPQIVLGSDDAANVGISLIVPATRLREVLDSKEAQSYRDAEVKRFLKIANSH